jgi:hypothetical protein
MVYIFIGITTDGFSIYDANIILDTLMQRDYILLFTHAHTSRLHCRYLVAASKARPSFRGFPNSPSINYQLLSATPHNDLALTVLLANNSLNH